jgi:hypothetical protein
VTHGLFPHALAHNNQKLLDLIFNRILKKSYFVAEKMTEENLGYFYIYSLSTGVEAKVFEEICSLISNKCFDAVDLHFVTFLYIQGSQGSMKRPHTLSLLLANLQKVKLAPGLVRSSGYTILLWLCRFL